MLLITMKFPATALQKDLYVNCGATPAIVRGHTVGVAEWLAASGQPNVATVVVTGGGSSLFLTDIIEITNYGFKLLAQSTYTTRNNGILLIRTEQAGLDTTTVRRIVDLGKDRIAIGEEPFLNPGGAWIWDPVEEYVDVDWIRREA